MNLALAVGPPDHARGAGRHPIASWMAPLNLFDDLTLTALEPGHFSRYAILWAEDARRRTDIDWSITRDLAVRAHHALEHATGRRLPIQLKLQKRIPVGAGLGGGSSDAAATLRGLNRLFDLSLSNDYLMKVGATIGSDVPFFIGASDDGAGGALVEGFGERIQPLPRNTSPVQLVVIVPEFTCGTAAVYRAFDELDDEETGDDASASFAERAVAVRELAAAAAADASQATGCLERTLGPRIFNDLQGAAVRNQPRLAETLGRVESIAERAAHVTGSGSAVFVVCDDAMHAEFLARALADEAGVVTYALATSLAQPHLSE